MADLNASSDFFNTITNYNTIGDYIPSTNYNPTARYTVTSVSITKRKTAPKETDDVYVSVAAESEHTTFQGDYHLLYNYYDVGGWVLDQVEPDESTWQYLPKDPVPDDIVIADTYSLLPIQDGSVSDIQHHLEDQSDVVSFQVNSTYTQYSIVGTMKIGYVRVSTLEQNTLRQEVLLGELGVDELFIDRASGKNTDRPELQKMLGYVRKGDTVIVESISRFARNTRDLLDLMEQLASKEVGFISKKEAIDTATPTGKFMGVDRQSNVLDSLRTQGCWDSPP